MPSGALVLSSCASSSPVRFTATRSPSGFTSCRPKSCASRKGSLYPALQRILLKGWVKAEWGISETNRKVRFYRLTPAGRKQLEAELSDYDRVNKAIRSVLNTA